MLSMTSGNHGPPVGATGRRLLSEREKILPPARSQVLIESKSPGEGGSKAGKEIDPLGLREAWLRTRKTIKQIAEKRKAHEGERKIPGRQIADTKEGAIRRIRERMQVMRDNLRHGLGDLERVQKSPGTGGSPSKDPPDKGGGITISTMVEGDQQEGKESKISREDTTQQEADQGRACIKGLECEGAVTQITKTPSASPQPLPMAGQENQKNKAIVEVEGEAPRAGDGSNTARVLLRGDSSRSQGGGHLCGGLVLAATPSSRGSQLTWGRGRRAWLSSTSAKRGPP
ncbi:hypothetical protein VPH35_059237 [Triticum aestivum]